MSRQELRRPRFDGTVNLGHCLTALTMLLGGLVVWKQGLDVQARMETRMVIVERTVATNTVAIQEAAVSQFQITRTQDRLATSLDLLISGKAKL